MRACGNLKRVFLVLVAAALLLMRAPPAGANIGPPLESPHVYQDEDGTPTAGATDETATGGQAQAAPSSAAKAVSECAWRVVISDDFVIPVSDLDGGRRFSETGRWLHKVCGEDQVEVSGYFAVPEGAEVDPRVLAVEALARAPISAPVIETSPSINGRLYTQIPTWLWIPRILLASGAGHGGRGASHLDGHRAAGERGVVDG